MDLHAYARLGPVLFDRPIMDNTARAIFVEYMVAEALGPDWRWVSSGWNGWDLENGARIRIEVRQSAARQLWHGRRAKGPKGGITPPTPSG